jgi:hypothetical protein
LRIEEGRGQWEMRGNLELENGGRELKMENGGRRIEN